MILLYLLAAFLLLYLVQIGVMLFAVRQPRDVIDDSVRPFVSVVIAARDEQENLAACLESTLHQTYGQKAFEVIVINDHSTDRTEQICKEFQERFDNFSYLNAREDAQLRGKTNALDQGIEKARGDVILITDADCSVPPTWVECTARRYIGSVGIVGGLTLQRASTRFEGMQSLDWAFLLGLAAATMSLRIPLSTIGNNLSFRKSAYLEVGGYRKIPFSVTEDFMLFQAIVQAKRWNYICPIDPKVLVISQPCSGWRELIRQKHRWGKGGLDMKLTGFSIMAIGFGLNLLVLLGLAAGEYIASTAALLTKMLGEFAFLFSILQKQRHLLLLRYFLWFELYFMAYVLVLPFMVFFGGRVIWKGRTY
ncbi:MAG: glycosyltransferase [Ignavibacteriales bacterium]|nr:glycosyltransferase [Ignavibacteriales bacterium]